MSSVNYKSLKYFQQDLRANITICCLQQCTHQEQTEKEIKWEVQCIFFLWLKLYMDHGRRNTRSDVKHYLFWRKHFRNSKWGHFLKMTKMRCIEWKWLVFVGKCSTITLLEIPVLLLSSSKQIKHTFLISNDYCKWD